MITVACRHCGAEFGTIPSDIARGNGKYCSRSCASKSRTGSRSSGWKGGRAQGDRGSWLVFFPDHPCARTNGYIYEHRWIAENALGRIFRNTAPVHHIDGNPSNNANSNLVICDSESYHRLLHARGRIQKLGGNPNTDKICSGCKAVKRKTEFPSNRYEYDGLAYQCSECNRRRCASYKRAKKAA